MPDDGAAGPLVKPPLPVGLNRPILPISCCMNEASVPGDGVVREATETEIASSWVYFLTPASTPRSSKVKTTTSWSSTPSVRPTRGRVTSVM